VPAAPVSMSTGREFSARSSSTCPGAGTPLLTPAGPLSGQNIVPGASDSDSDDHTNEIDPPESDYFIPQIVHEGGVSVGRKKRVLVLCTGGTLTMAPNPSGALEPVPGAFTDFMKSLLELASDNMPNVVVHEYTPLLDSSYMGPPDWAVLANDIKDNYLHYDAFVVLSGTDTMAYTASALSFMLENLGKPVVFTGSQVPIAEPHSDARQNLIMALIFAAREVPICEVTIFFHDRLIRACRATKVNTNDLHAFDSPNIEPLATTGVTIKENDHLVLRPARGVLKVHTKMDTRLLTIRLVPGFDDQILQHLIKAGAESGSLRALVLQLYGTGNAPAAKRQFIDILKEATGLGIMVVASTQCHAGSVMMGHYATGKALQDAGVVPSNDMTLEATSTKLAYLLGRGDLDRDQIAELMTVSIRGEVTPNLPPPPFTTAYQRLLRKGRYLY